MSKQVVLNYPGWTWDAIERVGWTAIQVAAGAALAELISGDAWSWQTLGYAVAVALLKVIVARQVGGQTARALPGISEEVTPK